ncbi:MAG: hypothetical protein IKV90_01355 [Clostridia bacterium]|nr:hypothetical protein [Clostridia bacterium]
MAIKRTAACESSCSIKQAKDKPLCLNEDKGDYLGTSECRCASTSIVFCAKFSIVRLVSMPHTTEGQKPGEIPIFPSYFNTMSTKKDLEELLLQGLS